MHEMQSTEKQISTASFILSGIGAVSVHNIYTDIFGYLCMTVGFGLLLPGLFNADWKIYGVFNKWPYPILVPLEVAAKKAYEANRSAPDAHLIEMLGNISLQTRDGRILFFAEKLGSDVTLYGTHPPSTRIEALKKNDMGHLSNDGSRTVAVGGEIMFDNVMVEMRDAYKFIRVIKAKTA